MPTSMAAANMGTTVWYGVKPADRMTESVLRRESCIWDQRTPIRNVSGNVRSRWTGTCKSAISTSTMNGVSWLMSLLPNSARLRQKSRKPTIAMTTRTENTCRAIR